MTQRRDLQALVMPRPSANAVARYHLLFSGSYARRFSTRRDWLHRPGYSYSRGG